MRSLYGAYGVNDMHAVHVVLKTMSMDVTFTMTWQLLYLKYH